MGARAKAKPKARPAAQASSSDSSSRSSSSSSSSSDSEESSSEGDDCPYDWPASAGKFRWTDWADVPDVPSECSADEEQSLASDEDSMTEGRYPTFVWEEYDDSDVDMANPNSDSDDEEWDEIKAKCDTPEDMAKHLEERQRQFQAPPPPTYVEALGLLPRRFSEQHLLYCMGDDLGTVRLTLEAYNIAPIAIEVLLRFWLARRQTVDSLRYRRGGAVVRDPWLYADSGIASTTVFASTSKPPPKPPMAVKRMTPIPSSIKGNETAEEKRRLNYMDTVHFIINETRTLGAELGLTGDRRPFPHCPPDASAADIAGTYGYVLTAKSKGGLIMLRGLRTRWNRVRRFLDAACDHGSVDVMFACQFIDFTKLTGMANTFLWAGEALGLPIFMDLGEDPTVAKRNPKRGWCAEAPVREHKQAPWVCDDFITYLAKRARSSQRSIRVRAVFFYILAIGGVRFSDAQHVVRVEIAGNDIIFTATRFKCTKGDSVETFAIPLLDMDGVSLEPAIRDLIAQMADGYMLAHPDDARDLTSANHAPKCGCSYAAAIQLLRQFASDYKATLSSSNEYYKDDFSKITMHSLRAWLATFARQAGVKPEETNELLHWTSGIMIRLYNRNFSATEVLLRRRILYIMASPWRSAGKGHELQQTAAPWDKTISGPVYF